LWSQADRFVVTAAKGEIIVQRSDISEALAT
jgi:hypothetical protein